MTAQETVKLLINEVFVSITDDDVRYFKSREDNFREKMFACVNISLLASNHFYPLRYIIYDNLDVLFSSRRRKKIP
jgi:hypothetical protein